jgi:hypothetical protein
VYSTVRFRHTHDDLVVDLCTIIGIYLLLTIQATTALMQRPRRGQRIADNRRTLLCYTLITFALGTLSFAGDTKYTEMIWIDLRNTPASGGPVGLIKNALHYRINFMAIFW